MAPNSTIADPPTSPDGRFRALGGTLAALVLIQATLAGQFLNSGAGALGPHRLIGEGLGLLALGLFAEGYRLRSRSPERWWLGAAVLAMVVVQTGLGFAGRDAAGAAAMHVPLGVATFGVSLVAALPTLRR